MELSVLRKLSVQGVEPKLLRYNDSGPAGAAAIHFWQHDLVEQTPEGTQLEPWAVRAHHVVGDRLIDRLNEIRESSVKGDLATTILLPCLYCGVVFDSRGGRARKCESCRHAKRYQRRIPRHVTGARPWSTGTPLYATGPDAPGVIWRVPCQHRGCDVVFDALRFDERYCDSHKGQRHPSS